MKNILSILFFVFLAISFVQCGDDEAVKPSTGELRIKFLPVYADQPLFMTQQVTYNKGLPIKIQRLSFFSQLLVGNKQEGETFSVDFSKIYNEIDAKNGVTKSFALPAGTYNNLQIGIGVSNADNKKQPSNYAITHPLSEPSEYWGAWESYIFSKTEGKIDEDGSGKYATPFSFHTGTDEMYRISEATKSINIEAGKATEITVLIDAKKVLAGRGGDIDFSTEKSAHSLSNKPTAIKIMDNFVKAVTIQ